MEMTIERHDDVVSISLSGRLDPAASRAIERTLRDSIAETDRAAILDLSGVCYIGSAGLRAVLIAAQELRARGVETVLCDLSGPVREVLRITCFDRFLSIRETAADALASLEG